MFNTNTQTRAHTHARISGHVSCDVCTFEGCNLIRNEDVQAETTAIYLHTHISVHICIILYMYLSYLELLCSVQKYSIIQSIIQIHQAISVKLVKPMIYCSVPYTPTPTPSLLPSPFPFLPRQLQFKLITFHISLFATIV